MSQSSFQSLPSLPPLSPAGGLAFPPALPALSFTFSDGGVYQPSEQKRHEIVLSKHQLSQQALMDSVIPACETLPNTVLQIITFNSRAQLLPNPKDFARVYADLGTNFESAFKCLAETESALKPGTRHVKLLLTDGYDSSPKKREELMATDEHVGIFDGIMGIGPDVDLAFLKHLSSKNPDTFTHACDPVTLQNAIKALCFGGANAIARDVSVVFWIENRNVYIPTDPSITVETVDMMDMYADPSVPVSNLFACDYCPEKNVFIFSVAQSSASASAAVAADAVQTVVTLLVDISGSMNDGVVQTRSRPIYASSKNEGCGFLKVTVKLRMLDDVYKFLGKGNPSLVEVRYTGRNGEVCREIVSGSTVVEEESVKTFGACETMLGIMRGLESSSTDINALYRSKLACRASILQDPSIPDYMKKLFSFVWDRLRNAYKMTLSAYDRFLERGQGPTESPCMMQLVHTLSAGASDTTASSSLSAVASSSDEDQSKCSICFDAESTILCLPCKHIGSCEPCFKKTFESASASASCPPCPFCKTPVEEVRQITSIKCPCCDSPATRVGVCRHPLACGKAACRLGDPSVTTAASGDTLYCHTCKEHVGSFHVWHQ